MILKERTYAALVEASHAMAVEKGWWDGGIEARSLDDQFNNFHAEISEAWEEYRAGRMETWYSSNGNAVRDADFSVVDGVPSVNVAALHKTEPEWIRAKPEGFWVEIADLLIRLADTCGAYGIHLVDEGDELPGLTCEQFRLSEMPGFVYDLHEYVGDIRDAFREAAGLHISGCFYECFALAKEASVDLWAIIELKMSYNATRSHRHGGKRA